MKVGMIVKMSNPDAVTLSYGIASWLKERGVAVHGDAELSRKVKEVEPVENLADASDVIVVLGGDGTVLYASRLIAGKPVPMLAINMGGLGFLTSVKIGEVYENLERVIKKDFSTEERMMLDVSAYRGDVKFYEYRALNDVVIKGKVARLVRMETRINREYVTTYRADGLIVATPTGSTAYALSASGPILHPTIHSIIIVPICPFNLTNRPVVVPDWMEVEVAITPENPRVELTLDGQVEIALEGGDRVAVKRADSCVYLIKGRGKSFFDILRERLMWQA
jgi:NAD+ kinase